VRIRSIKPEFWRSPDISELRIEDRLLFIGLWSYVDDNGVGQDRIATVCADLFADDLSRDPRETFARVSEGLERLSEAGRIVRYTVENRDYLAVENWSRHQRIDKPNKARYPRPDAENSTIREPLAESSRGSREIPAPGTGEQGNRGTEEQGTSSSSAAASDGSPYTDEFLEWWKHYPRKQDKGGAFKAWKKIKHATLDELIAGADRYANDPNRTDQYTKHAATWLNNRSWEDEDGLPARIPQSWNHGNDQRMDDGLAMVMRARQQEQKGISA
jgi:hypothetical protein